MPHPFAPRKVMVTGACGNLGQKVIEALVRTNWCEQVVGVDRIDDASRFSDEARQRLRLVKGDLTQCSGDWLRAVEGVDAAIHFAVVNALPDCTWLEAMASYDMTLNLLRECARADVGRFVFASSNHAMGAYKDTPLAAQMGPGRLRGELPPAPGTKWFDGKREIHSLAYGTSKAMGEKLCTSVTALTGGKLSSVSVRIGWALPGSNAAQDITHSGSPASTSETETLDDDALRTLRWFRNMWLSNRDLGQLFTRALSAPSDSWPSQAIVVNGMSNNRDMEWDLSSSIRYLGYQPVDDVSMYVERT